MNNKTVLIVGTHPLLKDVEEQYASKAYKLSYYSEGYENDKFDEIFIATEISKQNKESEDFNNIKLINILCDRLDKNKKTKIHLLLHSPNILTMFQRKELCANLKDWIEIYPFTLESIWAQNIFVSLPTNKILYPPLDREYIDVNSDKFVHAVVLNMNSMTETLAEYIVLTSHYANYTKNHSLRTRITIVDNDVLLKKNNFINRNKALFDNSFCRVVDLDDKKVVEFNKPFYYDRREDFVDVEWEFVKADINNQILRDKLSMWAKSDEQIMTLFLCSEEETNNLNDMMLLPKELEDNNVPVFVRTTSMNISDIFNIGNNVFNFGMLNCRYDINLPLVKLAKMVNFVYDSCYNDNYANDDKTDNVYSPVSIDMQVAEMSWNKLSSAKKWSNIYNAMTISSKMRALGYSSDNWKSYNGMSSKEIALVAEIEHNRWNVEELLLGFYPVTDEQEKEIEQDISRKKIYKDKFFHYDIRAYNDLRPDASGKNVSVYDICLSNAITLLANTFLTEINNE